MVQSGRTHCDGAWRFRRRTRNQLPNCLKIARSRSNTTAQLGRDVWTAMFPCCAVIAWLSSGTPATRRHQSHRHPWRVRKPPSNWLTPGRAGGRSLPRTTVSRDRRRLPRLLNAVGTSADQAGPGRVFAIGNPLARTGRHQELFPALDCSLPGEGAVQRLPIT